jgi:hypothetical protein
MRSDSVPEPYLTQSQLLNLVQSVCRLCCLKKSGSCVLELVVVQLNVVTKASEHQAVRVYDDPEYP